MKIVIGILFLVLNFYGLGQVKVYIGNQKIQSNLIYQLENKTFYRVNNVASKIDFLYLDGDKVYQKTENFSRILNTQS